MDGGNGRDGGKEDGGRAGAEGGWEEGREGGREGEEVGMEGGRGVDGWEGESGGGGKEYRVGVVILTPLPPPLTPSGLYLLTHPFPPPSLRIHSRGGGEGGGPCHFNSSSKHLCALVCVSVG